MKYDMVVAGSGGGIGETLAGLLADDPATVVFLDEDDRAVTRAVGAGADARAVDPSEASALDREELRDIDVAIVAFREDGRNLLVAQLLGLQRVERVITLVNDPANTDAFADAGVEPVCVTTTLANALDEKRHDRERLETTPANAAHPFGNDADEKAARERAHGERLRSDGGARNGRTERGGTDGGDDPL